MQDIRQYAPATLRNRDVILDVLLQVLPPEGTVLEIASGTGEHAVFFAPSLQPRKWIPSDPNPLAIASITAWQEHYPSDNLSEPLVIDVTNPEWSDRFPSQNQSIQAIVNINMIHISPWAACLGLMTGAKNLLPVGGILYLYGPFKQNGKHTSDSNADFDASLRYQNPEWGVRDLEDVVAIAAKNNLAMPKVQAMPANNLSVIFQVV
ncbi:MAG: SAM-dependent methyltransferase [Pseudanabaena frigida]|uniref:SAM-dependent methyltransferase n=1 Tax=Pseudanabaena frigida TaxID=945775 RepID=A0A2W4VTN9_9CYAN|nr:MAG: SAM-dependent methyltransferase [Pseudanabaena frigida]